MKILVQYTYYDVDSKVVSSEMLSLKEWGERVSSRNNSILYDIEDILGTNLKDNDKCKSLRNKILDVSAEVNSLFGKISIKDKD